MKNALNTVALSTEGTLRDHKVNEDKGKSNPQDTGRLDWIGEGAAKPKLEQLGRWEEGATKPNLDQLGRWEEGAAKPNSCQLGGVGEGAAKPNSCQLGGVGEGAAKPNFGQLVWLEECASKPNPCQESQCQTKLCWVGEDEARLALVEPRHRGVLVLLWETVQFSTLVFR